MHINLPDKTSEVLAKLDNQQKGMIFSALMYYSSGEDYGYYESNMSPEAQMAFSFLVMWNDMQKEKFQAKRVKYNQENRTSPS